MVLGYTGKDIFIIVNIFVAISAILFGSFKFRDKLNKKIDSGQLNKKQSTISYIELIIIVSVSMYSYIISLYNLIYNFNEEIIKSKGKIIDYFLKLVEYMKPAILTSLIIVIICFVIIKLLGTNKQKG